MRDVVANLDDYSVWLVAVVGGLGALGWLARKAVKGFRQARHFLRKIDSLLDLADHQLKNNGGSSLFDKVEKTAENVEHVVERVNDLTERFDRHLLGSDSSST